MSFAASATASASASTSTTTTLEPFIARVRLLTSRFLEQIENNKLSKMNEEKLGLQIRQAKDIKDELEKLEAEPNSEVEKKRHYLELLNKLYEYTNRSNFCFNVEDVMSLNTPIEDVMISEEDVYYPNQFQGFERAALEFMLDFHDGKTTTAGQEYKIIHRPTDYISAITTKYDDKKKVWKIVNTLTLDIKNKAMYSASLSMTSNLTPNKTASGVMKCVEYGFRHKVEIFLRNAKVLLAGPDLTLLECVKMHNALKSRVQTYHKYFTHLVDPTEDTKVAFLDTVIKTVENLYATIEPHEGARMKELGGAIPYYMIEREWNTYKTIYILSEFIDVHQPDGLFMKFCLKWGVTFGEYVSWERAREWGSCEDISGFSSLHHCDFSEQLETLTVDEDGNIQGNQVCCGRSNAISAAALTHFSDAKSAKLTVNMCLEDPDNMRTEKFDVPRNLFIHMYYMERLKRLAASESVAIIQEELKALVVPIELVKSASPKRSFSEI